MTTRKNRKNAGYWFHRFLNDQRHPLIWTVAALVDGPSHFLVNKGRRGKDASPANFKIEGPASETLDGFSKPNRDAENESNHRDSLVLHTRSAQPRATIRSTAPRRSCCRDGSNKKS